jgi:hypothetical protein
VPWYAWVALWSVLVIGTLVGGFFLARHVFRSAKALAAALGELAEVVDRLDRQVQALTGTVGTTPAPVDLADPEPARARRRELQVARIERRVRRADRHEQAYRRWWSLVR